MKKTLTKISSAILGLTVAGFLFFYILVPIVSGFTGDKDEFSTMGTLLFLLSIGGCAWLGILAGNMLYYKFYPKAERKGALKMTPKNKPAEKFVKLTEEQLACLSDKERKEYEIITAEGFTTSAPVSAILLGTWYEGGKYKKRIKQLTKKAINKYDDQISDFDDRIK